jgi:hypothetical protein
MSAGLVSLTCKNEKMTRQGKYQVRRHSTISMVLPRVKSAQEHFHMLRSPCTLNSASPRTGPVPGFRPGCNAGLASGNQRQQQLGQEEAAREGGREGGGQ